VTEHGDGGPSELRGPERRAIENEEEDTPANTKKTGVMKKL